jgi:DNA-3-methyladenine glycosylase
LQSRDFTGDATQIAPDLVGMLMTRRFRDGTIGKYWIVETEAYMQDDPACHAHRGQTPRNAAMFGPPGHAYVYLIYGIHHCFNIVTGKAGDGQAVLIRALADINWEQQTPIQQRRYAGPGKLCKELEIDRTLDGAPIGIKGKSVWIERPATPPTFSLEATTRVGISKGADRLWRWCWSGHPAVSRK